MKIRTDFVTNSSSSSFVLISKLSNQELVKSLEENKLFDFIHSSPSFYEFCKENEIDYRYVSRDDIRSWAVSKDSRGDYQFDTIMDNFPLNMLLDSLGGYIIETD